MANPKLFGLKMQGLLINALVAVVVIMLVNRIKPLKALILGEG